MLWVVTFAFAVQQSLLAQSEKVVRAVNPEGGSYVELLQDLVKRDAIKADTRSVGGWHMQYHRLEEINQKLREINSTYHPMTSLFSLGKTKEGRDMWAMKIVGKPKADKPVFFIQCLAHPREWITAATCMYFVDQMTQKYGKDESVTALLDKMDFTILPVVNPDGYAYSWINKYTRNWNKNRSFVRFSPRCYGVDLNRNWGYMWGHGGAGIYPSTYGCDETYRGYSAFSEKETQNIRNHLIRMGSSLKGFIDFQAYGQEWYIPWRYGKAENPDRDEQLRVAREAVIGIHNGGYYSSYMHGFSKGLHFPVGGGSEDYVYGALGVKYSFSVELRDGGRFKYKLPANQIPATGQETLEGVKALVKAMNV